MPTRTRFLSRLIGLYCAIVSISLVTHATGTIEVVNAIMRSTPLLLITGVMTLVAGLALVLSHNVWSGGTTAVVVTLVGWAALLKGLLLLALPPEQELRFLGMFHYDQLFYLYMGVTFVLGVWLTWAGFRADAG